MNCRSCGALLPQGARNCPRCGVAVSHSTPDDPTLASLPGAVSAPPPPGGHSTPDDTTVPASPGRIVVPPVPNEYNTLTYPTYNDVSASVPPRSGRRIGLIIIVVVLVLLLAGGGVFVRLNSAASNTAATNATATTTARANASATASAQVFTANGTDTITNTTTNSTRQDGSNTVVSITQQATSAGDVAGPVTNEETVTIYPDKTETFSGTSSCTCTVSGRSGILLWSFTGTQAADGNYQGQVTDVHGTGGLAKIQGQGSFQGLDDHDTYSTQLHFDA